MQLDAGPAGVLQDSESTRDGPVSLGDVDAELEHAFGRDGVDRGRVVGKAGGRAAAGVVDRPHPPGVAARIVDDVEAVPLVRPGDDPQPEVVLRPRVVRGIAREAQHVGDVGVEPAAARRSDHELAALVDLDLQLIGRAEEVGELRGRFVQVPRQLVVVDQVADGPLSLVDLVRDLLDVGERRVELGEIRLQALHGVFELALLLVRPDHLADGLQDVAGLARRVAGVLQDGDDVSALGLGEARQVAREALEVGQGGVQLCAALVDDAFDPFADAQEPRHQRAQVVFALGPTEYLAQVSGDVPDVTGDLVQRLEDVVHRRLPDHDADLVAVLQHRLIR